MGPALTSRVALSDSLTSRLLRFSLSKAEVIGSSQWGSACTGLAHNKHCDMS